MRSKNLSGGCEDPESSMICLSMNLDAFMGSKLWIRARYDEVSGDHNSRVLFSGRRVAKKMH